MNEAKPTRPPFWTTLPGILTGLGAVITALTGLLVALNGAGIIGGSGATAAPTSSQTAPASGGGGGSASGIAPALTGCLAGFFAVDDATRVQMVEAGTQGFDVIPAQAPKTPPFGVVITEGGQPVTALRVQFVAGGEVFRVLGVVTGACAPISGLRNIGRGGDPTLLQNWDTVRVPVGDKAYDVRLGASSTLAVSVDLVAP